MGAHLRQVQNLMARAEYLKEQIKVSIGGAGSPLSLPARPLCCPSVLPCVPQVRESRWAAEALDKEPLSESVRSCESPGGGGRGPGQPGQRLPPH